jgi:hypothetical protein
MNEQYPERGVGVLGRSVLSVYLIFCVPRLDMVFGNGYTAFNYGMALDECTSNLLLWPGLYILKSKKHMVRGILDI